MSATDSKGLRKESYESLDKKETSQKGSAGKEDQSDPVVSEKNVGSERVSPKGGEEPSASQSLTDREQEVPSYGATQSNKEPATAGEDVNLASESSHKPADQSLSPVRGEQAPPIITPKSETPPPPNYQYRPPGNGPPSYRGSEITDRRPPRFSKADLKSGRKKDAAARCINWCLGSVLITTFLILFILVPIASIVIGALKIDKCPVETRLPVWLIVFGSFFLVLLFTCIIVQMAARRQVKKIDPEGRKSTLDQYTETDLRVSFAAALLILVLLLFLLAWFIVGHVYIIPKWDAVEKSEAQCDYLLFYFSFAVIIFLWAVGIVLCCICCVMVCVAISNEEDSTRRNI